jgi:hypothetical protein
MSSASTIGLPYLKSAFTAPVFVSGVAFNFILENDNAIPIGNYLVWTYLFIEGDTDTDLGTIVTALDNGILYPNTFNPGGSVINDGSITFQYSQLVIISAEQPNINLQGALQFNGNAPTVTGSIFFLPI